MLFPDQAGSGLVIIQTCGLESPVVKTKLSLTQSRKLLTHFFSFGAFAALAKDFAGDEFGQNRRGYGLNSGWATHYAIF
jgi:hypothetical protein